MGPFFIDIEAFQHGVDGKFVIKELSIIDVDKPLHPLYYIFEAHKTWQELDSSHQRTYEYQTAHLHHLEWHEGNTRYCKRCIMHHIKKHFGVKGGLFYVMGDQKLNFLQEEFPDLNFIQYNITFDKLPILPPNIHCLYRNHGHHCALLKCMRMYLHYTMYE